jgi:transcriptional regulator with XRE-family HTH domain
MKVKEAAAVAPGTAGESEPVRGIRAMRERLADAHQSFRAAVDDEAEAERFCQSLRDDLRTLRVKRELDQSSLAKELGMTQSAVSKLEKSAGDIGLKTVFRYARALGLRPVCVFVPSAEQLIKEAPQSQDRAGPAGITPQAALAMEAVEVKLVRSMSDSLLNVMPGLARAGDD